MPTIQRLALCAFALAFFAASSLAAPARESGSAPDVPKPETVPPAPTAPAEPLGQPPSREVEAHSAGKALGGRPISPEAALATDEAMKLMRSRHFEEAIDALQRAADADSKHPVVWNNLGSAYLAVGKVLPAERAFHRAIRLDPNYAMAHYNLGAVRDEVLDYDGAVASYARALELDSELGDAKKNPAIVNNDHLAAIHLILYKRQLGSLGTGLTPVKELKTEESEEQP